MWEARATTGTATPEPMSERGTSTSIWVSGVRKTRLDLREAIGICIGMWRTRLYFIPTGLELNVISELETVDDLATVLVKFHVLQVLPVQKQKYVMRSCTTTFGGWWGQELLRAGGIYNVLSPGVWEVGMLIVSKIAQLCVITRGGAVRVVLILAISTQTMVLLFVSPT